jgi:hypothetical protein
MGTGEWSTNTAKHHHNKQTDQSYTWNTKTHQTTQVADAQIKSIFKNYYLGLNFIFSLFFP